MRKNILIISIICLLTITISYTYSTFNNTIKGTITATTNNWKFSASVPSGIIENDYYKVPINSNNGSFDVVLNNKGSLYLASYIVKLELINLPDDFTISDSLYEGILNDEEKTIKVTYSSNSSVNGYIKIKIEGRKQDYVVMKNGYQSSSEFWSDTYRQYIRTIKFGNDLSNLPSECTEENLCWDISEDENQKNKVYGYLVDSGEVDSKSNVLYNLYIVSEACVFAPNDCSYIFSFVYFYSVLFYEYRTNFVSIEFNNNFITSNVENMSNMFWNCTSLTEFDLSSFNTTNVTNMSNMFYGCTSLTEFDLSSFNTSNVTSMNNMFYGCSSLTELDLSSFNTSSVTDMYSMFKYCRSLKTLDLSGFNTLNVRNMEEMFSGCKLLTELDLSSFNTSNVTSMYFMFDTCSSLTKLDLSSFNTTNVTTMIYMFSACSSLTELDLSSFNTSNVTNMSYMFSGCSLLTELDLSSFNTSNVTTMCDMFRGCSSLAKLDLSNFITSNVDDMDKMFYNCSSLTSINLSGFNTSKVTCMSSMFYNCSSLTSINLSSFNTSNVILMDFMFDSCSSLTELDLSSFNTSKVTNMNYMFRSCSSLTTKINIMSTSVTSYSKMFTDAATESGAKITVNYIADASSLVDNMIATKSDTSNVVKGSQL